MITDEKIGLILAEMSDTLTPQPDPYVRVKARHRRQQRARLITAGIAVILVASVAGGAALVSQRGAAPSLPSDSTADNTIQAWAERLATSAPRGGVSDDHGYVAALADRLLQEQHRFIEGRGPGVPVLRSPATAAKVLFVDDIGSFRVALVAYERSTPDPDAGRYASIWLVAPRGATAEQLVSAQVVDARSALNPYMGVQFGGQTMGGRPDESVDIAIVPQGCVLSTAAWPAVNDWQPEPTTSYLVRTTETQRPEWWRATCDGTERMKAPAPGAPVSYPISDAVWSKATSRLRGTMDAEGSETVREAFGIFAGSWGYAVTAAPTMVWNGRWDGGPEVTYANGGGCVLDGTVTIGAAPLVAPHAGTGWVADISVKFDQPSSNGNGGCGWSFSTASDPSDPDKILAIPLADDNSTLLVIAPNSATTVRAVHNGQEVARGQVTNAAVILTDLPGNGVVIEALGAGDEVLATGQVAGGFRQLPELYDWALN